jgi:transposase IS204/IS1001/IS1096/IS1165 family protein
LPVQSAMPPAGTATAAGAREISGQDEALVAMLFPHLTRLRMHRVADVGEAVVISASWRAEAAGCPRCGQESSRVHGGYSRVVADGAAGSRPVLIALQVRRFGCLQPQCPAVTFAEQAEGVTGRYCRRSVPLTAMLAGFGLELAGRASARLACSWGSPCTRPPCSAW